MTKNAVSFYMVATCVMVAAAPGRFACGFALAFSVCFLMLTGTLFRALLKKLRLEQMEFLLMASFIVFATMFVRQLLAIMMPEMALQLGFALYLPSVSTFTTLFLFERKERGVKSALKDIMRPTLVFSAYSLGCALIRDVLGYGTITLPAFGRMYEQVVADPERISMCSFLATVPGALTLCALLLAAYLAVERKMKVLETAGLV
ncbi:MAG: hypothetical protein K2H09_01260 [Treponemataceae bacterium]|nr:hypothetical protein [Treponemataceae bacterium]